MENLDARLVLLDEDHSGRDEMNLAGNPFALLQAASKNGVPLLRREWERKLPSGKIVTAIWKVEGSTELGMPGPSEELLYLVLLQITREIKDETNEWHQTVHFSRHDVLNRLKWHDGPRQYKSLKDGFFRLQAVSIQTEYSFHDPRTGAPLPALAFNLIDSFAFVDEKKNRRETDLPLSWFKWSDVVLNSLQNGNVRSLALDFTLSLETPISRRLFRLLELLRHARKPALDEVKLDIFALRDRLGMTTYAYSSKVKEKLQPAIDELVERSYLNRVDYLKEKKTETAIFVFGSVKRSEAEIGQGRAEQGSNPKTPKNPAKTSPKPQQMALLDEAEQSSDVRTDAIRCHAVFVALDESERNELLELARAEVSPIWHDRVGQPESPMSLGLWQLVAQRYRERLK